MAFTATKDVPLATTTTGSGRDPPGTRKACGDGRSTLPCSTLSTASSSPTPSPSLFQIRSAQETI